MSIRSLLALFVLAFGACEPKPISDQLVTLEGYSLSDDGGSPYVILQGTAFPQGRACSLHVQGTLSAPQRAERRVSAKVPCRTSSEQVATAPLVPWLESLEGGPLFEGKLRIEFEDDQESIKITSQALPARLRLRDLGSHSAASSLALAQSARAFQRMLGIEELEAQVHGLTVTRIAAESPAARAGLKTGDVLTRVQDAPIELPEDLFGSASAGAIRLTATRPGHSLPLTFELSYGARGPENTKERWFLWGIGAVAALGVSRAQQHAKSSRTEAVGFRWARLQNHALRQRAWVWLSALLLLGLSAMLADAIDVRIVWGIPALVQLCALTLAYRQDERGLTELMQGLIELGATTLAIFSLGVVHGSLHVPLAQGAWFGPADFALFTTPAVWLGCFTLLALPIGSRASTSSSHVLARASTSSSHLARASTSSSHLARASTSSSHLARASTARLASHTGRIAAVLGFASAPMNASTFLFASLVGALLLALPEFHIPRLFYAGLALLAPAWALLFVALDTPRLHPGMCAALAGFFLTFGAHGLISHFSRRARPILDPALSPFV